MNKRISFKSTSDVEKVMLAVADKRNSDVGDLIHSYFYKLALDDMSGVKDNTDTCEGLLFEMFNTALYL